VCRECEWIGDQNELYGKVLGKSLEEAVSELILEGLVHYDEITLALYLDERHRNATFVSIWRAAQAEFRDGVPASRAVLQAFRCFYHQGSIKQVSRTHGALRADMLRDAPFEDEKAAKRHLGAMGRWSHLAIPCWDGSLLTGFWLLHERAFDEQYYYFPILNRRVSIGYGHVLSPMDELCLVTNDPRVACRLMVKQGTEATHPIVVSCPAPDSTVGAEQISAREVLFLHLACGMLPNVFLKEAARFPGGDVRVALDSKVPYPLLTEYGRLSVLGDLRAIQKSALPPYQAMGQYLLGRPNHEAIRIALGWGLETQEQAQVLQGFSGGDHDFIKRALDADLKTTTISLDGITIQETAEGWKTDGKVISEASIRIDELTADRLTGQAILTGTVSFLDRTANAIKVVGFREDLAVIEKNPGKWLKSFCLAHNGWIDVAPKWSARLLTIAKKFSQHHMQVTVQDRPFGWSEDRVLRFGRFSVDCHGVTRVAAKVRGPDTQYPTSLSASEGEVFSSRDFCMAALVLIGNLYLTMHGKPGHNIAVEAAPHLVDRLANSFGAQVEQDPVIAQCCREATHPLPRFSRWAPQGLGEIVRGRLDCHILTSVDPKTFQLLAGEPGWVRLPVNSLPEYGPLRWCFLALPALMLDTLEIPDDGYFYSNLAKKLGPLVNKIKPGHNLMAHGSELDACWVSCKSSSATQLVKLIRGFYDRGELTVVMGRDGVEVRVQDVMKCLVSPILDSPNIPRLTKQLVDGKMLVRMERDLWVLDGQIWELVSSNLMG
jgi:hypothetical protein